MDEEGLKEGLRSVAIIPVIHQDRVIACINVASHQYEEVPATARAALETLAAQVGSAIARVQAEEALRRAKDDLEIRVAERTAQLQQANESLEAELRVRRDMEKSLRYSEAKYRTLVEQIPAITYTISLAAGVDFLYVSPQVETLLGFSPEAWRADAENWERQIHPDDRERLLAEITHSLETGEPFSTEYRLLAKSGRVVWFRDEARVVYDPEGQFLFLQGLALDITERKQAEEALRQTTQTLQTLIQASPLAIITLDLDFKISLWNPGAERMFGWKESEVLGGYLPVVPGQTSWPRKTPGSSWKWRERRNPPWNLSACAKTARFLTCIYGLRRCWMPRAKLSATWGFLPISPRASGPRRSCAGRPNFWTWPTMPLSSGTWTTASSSGIPGPRKPMAGARPRCRGKKPHKLLHTEFPQPQEELEAELFRQGQWQGELSHTRRDGRRIVVTSRWALQRDKEGKPAAILEINRDITGQKQAEAGRARLAAILEATSDLVGTADQEGRVLYLNRAGRKMLGIGVDEDVSGLTVKDLQPEWAYRLIRDQGDVEAIGATRSGAGKPRSGAAAGRKSPRPRWSLPIKAPRVRWSSSPPWPGISPRASERRRPCRKPTTGCGPWCRPPPWPLSPWT